jgi:hypothetical protein
VVALGGDTVTLVFRDSQETRGSLGGVHTRDRKVEKPGWAFEEETPSETNTNAPVAKIRARAFGPVDPDIEALTEDDALERLGKTFELLATPQLWTDMDGNPDHYEILCEWTDNARTD